MGGEAVERVSLRQGDRGPAVEALQRALGNAAIAPGPSDGIFGPVTDAAVRRFQARWGLVVDGIAGPRTLAALGLDAAPTTLPTGADPHAIPVPPEGWIVGVDISDAQGLVDGEALAAAGVSFAYLKVSDGRHDAQRYAATNARAIIAAGIPVGFYGVLEPYGVEAVEAQVVNLCRRIEETGITPTLPPWCDFELAAGQSGIAALTSAAIWCELTEAATGRRPMIYTGPAFFALLAHYAGSAGVPVLARIARFPLAVAHYGRTIARGPDVPAPWQDWTVWQYSGDPAGAGQKARPWSKLPGSRGAVDVDFFRGTIEDLRALGKVEA